MKKTAGYLLLSLTLLAGTFLLVRPRSKALPPTYLKSKLPYAYGQMARKKADTYLMRDVAVIPMNRDTLLLHQNVLIEKGKIKQITRVSEPIDTAGHPTLIDGAGRYLMPGLNDMHVHVNDEDNLLLFIANGVTTVRNMAGDSLQLRLREKIARQEVLGPTYYVASQILEGPDHLWKFSTILNTKKEARAAVLKYQKSGYDFIKVYHTLPKELYLEILRVADSVGIRVVGHIPFQVPLYQTLALSQYSLEHVDVRPISAEVPLIRKCEMIGKSGKWVCPTLLVYRNIQKSPLDPSIPTDYEAYVDEGTLNFWRQRLHYFGPNKYALQKNMAKIMFNNGGRFVVGTDCLNSYVLAGFSMHDEMEELVSAGLPAYEVLKASTVNAAGLLHRADDIGTIEPGKTADLVLLNANPLEAIANTRKIRGVMVKGKWFSAEELNKMLAAVRKNHASSPAASPRSRR
ncbi:amidohydrolase family protein [Salmonirosea aquatica]|uniref:Amidohydrolase family protein n=1 Tax=Salmonirosea aquatica TaxID=2654236 RepID=A0A7C9FF15_9BACT|nr:amidohydrolase family protein [Cytophagaceae bacterium SJW1-29]